jgi:hypothetical protein
VRVAVVQFIVRPRSMDGHARGERREFRHKEAPAARVRAEQQRAGKAQYARKG